MVPTVWENVDFDWENGDSEAGYDYFELEHSDFEWENSLDGYTINFQRATLIYLTIGKPLVVWLNTCFEKR